MTPHDDTLADLMRFHILAFEMHQKAEWFNAADSGIPACIAIAGRVRQVPVDAQIRNRVLFPRHRSPFVIDDVGGYSILGGW
jgi:hypothetical protein